MQDLFTKVYISDILKFLQEWFLQKNLKILTLLIT